ncbi:MAG: RNA polymerase sigma factor [Actinobacteria bacterium]|nr:RNA polymerase sigma factor [Actinomycetota bacterium]
MEDFDQVLSAAQAGQEWALTLIYRAHHPALFRYLRWCDPKNADDLAGETWLAFAKHLSSFEGDESALRGWLFSIAHRRAIDEQRRRARRKTDPVSAEVIESSLESVLDPGHPGQESEGIEALAAQKAVSVLLSGLPREQAQIIALRVLGGLNISEVAELLGKRPGSIRVAQHRALKRLSETLTPEQVRKTFEGS